MQGVRCMRRVDSGSQGEHFEMGQWDTYGRKCLPNELQVFPLVPGGLATHWLA